MSRLTDTYTPVKRGRTHTRPPLRELVAAIDLPRLVEQYAGTGKRSGRHFTFRCPNPSHPDTHPSFVVYEGSQRGRWLCVCNSACGQVGDALDFVKWVRGCDDRTAVEELRRFAGEPANFVAPYSHKHGTTEPKPTLTETQPPEALDDAATLAAYLEGRGWPAWVVERFGLSVVRDKYGTKRIRHPFHAFTGQGATLRVIEAGYQSRACDPHARLRWVGPEGVVLPLYNLTALEPATVRVVVLCEGPADTITAEVAVTSAGLEGVACVGVPGVNSWRTAAAKEWAKWLRGLFVIVAADNDPAGENFAAQVAADLEGIAAAVSVLVPSPGNDLTDMATQVGCDEVGRLVGDHMAALEAAAAVAYV